MYLRPSWRGYGTPFIRIVGAIDSSRYGWIKQAPSIPTSCNFNIVEFIIFYPSIEMIEKQWYDMSFLFASFSGCSPFCFLQRLFLMSPGATQEGHAQASNGVKLNLNKKNWLGQGGPLSVINGVITTISRVVTPVTHLFSVIYRGYVTPLITDGGPPCGRRKKDSKADWKQLSSDQNQETWTMSNPVNDGILTHRIHGTNGRLTYIYRTWILWVTMAH